MRGYGVPDGLATLALDKTRCAPYSRSQRGHFQPPTRAPPEASAAARRLGPPPQLGVWPVAFAPGRPYSRWSSGLTRSGWPCGRLRAPPRGLSRAPLACARSPRALYLEEAAQEVFRSAPKSRRSVRAPAPETNRNGERRCGRGSAHPETLSRLAARRLVPRTPRARSRSAPADADRYGSFGNTAGGKDPAGS